MWDRGETGMPVAGPGAPLVAEFSVTEFAAAIGLPTEAGKAYLGEAVELRYRLGRIWSRVIKGDLPAWRARRIARETMLLSMEAAAYVDRHVAHVAHKVRPAQLDRLVEEAIGRFMPEEAERRRRQAADGRSFTIDTRQPSLAGHQHRVRGARPRRRPRPRRRRRRRRAGAEGPRLHRHPGRAPGHRGRRPRPPPAHPRPQPHPRRMRRDHGRRPDVGRRPRPATATRRSGPTQTSTAATRKARKPRQVVLYVHLSDAAVVPGAPLAGEFGRVENTRGPVHAEQIRQWCGNPDAQITVNPVIDLNEHIDVEAYEIRGRLREQTILTHPTCVFPWCTQTRPRPGTRRARRRLRPPGPLRQGPTQLLLQHRPPVPAPSPGQDPRRLDLHRPRTRDACVDQPARLPVPPRPPRHPRREPRPTPPPAGPLHPPPGRLTPPPHTPPDHHRRGPRHVRGRAGRSRPEHPAPSPAGATHSGLGAAGARRVAPAVTHGPDDSSGVWAPHRVSTSPAGGWVSRSSPLVSDGLYWRTLDRRAAPAITSPLPTARSRRPRKRSRLLTGSTDVESSPRAPPRVSRYPTGGRSLEAMPRRARPASGPSDRPRRPRLRSPGERALAHPPR